MFSRVASSRERRVSRALPREGDVGDGCRMWTCVTIIDVVVTGLAAVEGRAVASLNWLRMKQLSDWLLGSKS